MDQKWTHWEKIGLKGPAPSLMAWGNGGLFMEMLANKTDPFEYVEKYGNVSGKARRIERVFDYDNFYNKDFLLGKFIFVYTCLAVVYKTLVLYSNIYFGSHSDLFPIIG